MGGSKYGAMADRDPVWLWNKIAATDDPGECWEWQAAVNDGGYGIGWHPILRRTLTAHRMVWMVSTESPLPSTSIDICHSCDNRKCCNPAHLWAGTRADNMADCARKGRNHRPAGERSPKAKLTASQVIDIRAEPWKVAGISMREHARRMGMSHVALLRIVARDTWRCLDD